MLPKMFGRKESLLIPFDSISNLEVKRVEKEDAKDVPYERFAPTITFSKSDGSMRRAKIAEWWNRSGANEFAAWLGERLGRP